MRILWFTSTPSLAASIPHTGSNLTGWVTSLEKAVTGAKKIILGVAFPHGYGQTRSFNIRGTSYFSFPKRKEKGKISGLLYRWAHKIEHETEINHYLQIIEQFKPDLIHIFGSEAAFGNILNHITGIPVVIQIQGSLSACALKYFAGMPAWDTVIYSHKKSFLLGYSTWHQYFTFQRRAARERTFMKKCRYVIGRTGWDRQVSRVLAPDSEYFHCEEIMREPFYDKQWTRPDQGKLVLFSTLSGSTYKGFDVVLRTASLLREIAFFDFEWHIAGIDSSHELIAITERSLHQTFADNNVILRGMLSPDELAEGLLSSAFYVHPSYIENSSNAICEAMLLGVPVIATNAGGTESILSGGADGILVPTGDPYALAGAVKELYESPDKAKLYSENARRKAHARHDPSAILKNLMNIYKNILKR